MICFNCNNEMINGFLKLRSSHKGKVIFSDSSESKGIINKIMAGTIFDKTKDNEIEILNSFKKIDKIKSYYCIKCNILIVK